MTQPSGLMIKLRDDVPAIIFVGDKVIKLYHSTTGQGQARVKIVADKDVHIFSPQRVIKGTDPRDNRK